VGEKKKKMKKKKNAFKPASKVHSARAIQQAVLSRHVKKRCLAVMSR